MVSVYPFCWAVRMAALSRPDDLHLLDVAVDFGFEIGGHVQLALAEYPGHAQYQPLLLGHLWVIDLQRGQVFVVALFHFLSPVSKFVELFGSCLAVCIGKCAIKIGKIDVLRLDGIEEFLRRRSLLQKLPMLAIANRPAARMRATRAAMTAPNFFFRLVSTCAKAWRMNMVCSPAG